MNSLAKSGNLTIETLRGVAILVVVAHHAALALGSKLTELQLEPGLMRELAGTQSGLFQPIRMPLFTLLSGWVYALRPATKGRIGIFLGGKFRRILIPLIFVSTVLYFYDLLATSAYPIVAVPEPRPLHVEEFWLSWFFRYEHLWFLHAIFVLFVAILLIDLAGAMKSVRQWLLWMSVAALLPYVMPTTPFWSLAKLPDLTVFFIAGVGLNRFGHLWESKYLVAGTWVVFSVAMLMHIYWKISGEHFDPWPHFVLAGITAPACALSLKFQWKPLVWIGGYSYSIYLYHPFVSKSIAWADSLLASTKLQVAWFAGVVVAGILLPILIDMSVRRIPYVRTLVVGRKAGSARPESGRTLPNRATR